MVNMFHDAKSFNGDISECDVLTVTDMRCISIKRRHISQAGGWDVTSASSSEGVQPEVR